MHQLGPISTSLALDDARRASLAKLYTLVTHAYTSHTHTCNEEDKCNGLYDGHMASLLASLSGINSSEKGSLALIRAVDT